MPRNGKVAAIKRSRCDGRRRRGEMTCPPTSRCLLPHPHQPLHHHPRPQPPPFHRFHHRVMSPPIIQSIEPQRRPSLPPLTQHAVTMRCRRANRQSHPILFPLSTRYKKSTKRRARRALRPTTCAHTLCKSPLRTAVAAATKSCTSCDSRIDVVHDPSRNISFFSPPYSCCSLGIDGGRGCTAL